MLKGSQGVGIKATCYTSTYFKIETVHNQQTWNYIAEDFCKFNDPSFQAQLIEPSTEPTDKINGTILEYRLNSYSVEEFLTELADEYCAETEQEAIPNEQEFKRAIETYFRMKTYLGCVQRLLGVNAALKPIDVEVNVHFDFQTLEMHESLLASKWDFVTNAGYFQKIISHSFPGKYLDVLEIYKALPKSDKADRLYTNIINVLRNPSDSNLKKVLIQKFEKDDAKQLLCRTQTDTDTQQLVLEEDPVKIQRHRAFLNAVNGLYIVIAQRPYMGKYLQMGPAQTISVNGLPTTITITTPRGGLGYLNNIHIVIDVDTTLGFGKRNIPSRTKGVIDAYFIEAWSMLRRVIMSLVGVREGKDPATLPVWNKDEQYDNYQSDANLMKDLPLFFKTAPREEQEVVALFFELVGRKLLKGYFPFRVGLNRATYDALFYISSEEAERMPKSFRSRELKIVEFKFHLSELIDDFNSEFKYLEDIDLVVCWDNNYTEEIPEYNISSLERDGVRALPGATLRVHRGTQSCQVLLLKDFIETLEFG